MPAKKKSANEAAKKVSFEEAVAALEEIVDGLEAGNIPLEEALKKYEEGVKLSRVCTDRLSQVERKVEILTKTLNGEIKTESFDEALAEKEAPTPKQKKHAQNPKSDASPDDEDFLF